MIEIRTITAADPLYAQEVELRERALLVGAGFPSIEDFKAAYPGYEERFEHFVAIVSHPKGDRVVGCALLVDEGVQPDGERIGKVMQMAVDPQRQREGIGRRLLAAIEKRAFGVLGMSMVYCHAQVSAVGFYQKLGWSPEGDGFVEAGIDHRRMEFRAIPSP